MSELSSSDKQKEDLIEHIKKFKLLCENYKNKDKNFNEELLISTLNYIYSDVNKRGKLCKILISEHWCKCVVNLLKTFLERINWDLFDVVCNFIINLTDKYDVLCDSLAELGLAKILVDMFIKVHDKNLISSHNRQFFMTIITATHNIARHVHLQQYFLQHPHVNRFRELIRPLRTDKSDEISILATFALTWLVQENEFDSADIIAEQSDIVKIIFHSIEELLASENRRFSGWSLWELLQGLAALSLIDSIKHQMIGLEEFLPTLIGIMTGPMSTAKEVELSLGILWNLSFVDEYKDLLKTKFDLETLVEPLKRSDTKSIRRNAAGILWDLKKSSDDDDSARKKALKYDIFISYSHSQMNLVTKIDKELRTNFAIWIDKTNIKGSSLDDMASGIERSRLFVMCISNSYKQSAFCRSEANYAYKIKKPIIPLIMEHKYKPDGWLGIIVSSEFYIDVSDGSKLSESIAKVTEAITYKLKGTKPKLSLSRTATLRQSSEKPKSFKNWNTAQVSQWLTANQLSALQQRFEGFDGDMINGLVTMKSEVPQIYYKSLDRKMKLTFPEILKLTTALSKLTQ